MNQGYIDSNIKFLTINSCSNKSRERSVYKTNKVKSKFEVTKERKQIFYSSSEWKIMRLWMLENYDNICFSCGSTEHLEVDHIQPISRFPHGALKHRNLQILCRSCNSLKSNRTSRRFKAAIHKVKPFLVSEEIKILGKHNYWFKFFPEIIKEVIPNEELSN